MKRLGIFGGIFDPIHFGHLQVAEASRDFLNLSNLIFVPSGFPPHKESPVASCQDRLNMLEMAISKNPYFSISKLEIERKECSYTKDTVEKLKVIYKATEFYFVIGSDTISELSQWKEIDKLFREIQFVAVTRQGFPIKDTDSYQTAFKMITRRQGGGDGSVLDNTLEETTTKPTQLAFECDLVSNIQIITSPTLAISSSEIRRRVKEGRSIKYLVPERVEEYIYKNDVYK